MLHNRDTGAGGGRGVGRPAGRPFMSQGETWSVSSTFKIRLLHPAVGAVAFPLMPGSNVVVGRQSTISDVEITWDPRISRRHCRLWERDGGVWFQDLTSRNGSWIGEKRVSGLMRLVPGTCVVMGDTRLVVPGKDEVFKSPRGFQETDDIRSGTPSPFPFPPARGRRRVPSPDQKRSQSTAPARARDAGPQTGPKDLKASNVPTAFVSAGPQTRVLRVTPRLLGPNRAEVNVQSRAELHDLWVHDIAKGGLFVATMSPPARGASIEVHVKTPDGTILLHGAVVQVITPEQSDSMGGQAGIGIQFTDLNPATKAAIHAYVTGESSVLDETDDEASTMSRDETEGALEFAHQLLRESESSDYYTALGLPANASQDRVDADLTSARNRLTEAARRAPPTQAARLEAALNLLERMRRVLTQAEGRLEYDFRHGHSRAQERIQRARAGSGLTLEQVREIWGRVHPARVEKASLLTRKAFIARHRHDLQGAIEAGRAALRFDPFFTELLQTVEAWEACRDELMSKHRRR